MSSVVPPNEAGQLAADLAVLAEPHRLRVLGELRAGSCSAGDLARATGMAPSLASHHLAVLLRADYVSRWRKGSFVFYSLNPDRVGAVVQGMTRLTRPTGGRNGRAAHVRATEPPPTASRLTGSA